MSVANTLFRHPSKKRSSVLFLVAGVLLIGHATLLGLRLFTEVRPPTGLFAALGHLVAGVALVTLYPMLTDQIPLLSRVIVIAAVIPVVGWFMITTEQLFEIAGVLPPRASLLPSVFYVVVLVSTVTAYVLFAVACRRAGFSRSFYPLLLAPGILPVAWFTAQFVGKASESTGFLFVVGMALSLLTIGYALRITTLDDRRGIAGTLDAGIVNSE